MREVVVIKNKKICYFRQGIFLTCLSFCVFSILFFALRGEREKSGMAIISILYLFIPVALQKAFRFYIQTPLFLCVIAYTVCPLLGYSYNLYYLLPWWDDLLHAFAGLIFATFGAFLATKFAPKSKLLFRALFALVFSIAVAAVWEIIEFSVDSLFGTDMQKDILLPTMRPSYLLGKWLGLPIDEMAVLGETTTVINGVTVTGYIDIGLIDTMCDILIESFGALVYAVVYMACKGEKFVFLPLHSPVLQQEELLAPQKEAALSTGCENDL